MPVFKLMRLVHETPDRVTQEISLCITERSRVQRVWEEARKAPTAPAKVLLPDSRYRSPTMVDLGTFFMEFWNMKQRGELIPDEPPATWAVLMRAIDPATAVRIMLAHCISATEEPANYAIVDQFHPLLKIQADYKTAEAFMPPGIAKLRTKLVEALRIAAGASHFIMERHVRVLDPIDASLLLSACETALVVKEQEAKQWATGRC
jgi:hypothetical protein